MQDLLFDLEVQAPAENGAANAATRLAEQIGLVATNQTWNASSAIDAWAKATRLNDQNRTALVGVPLVCHYGFEQRIAQVVVRPDGDSSFLVVHGSDRSRLTAIVSVRIEEDGSFVTSIGSRFVLASQLPNTGESTGEPCGLEIGDICVGLGYYPCRVTARRGRWGRVQPIEGKEGENIRFLGDGIKVPDSLLLSDSQSLSAEQAMEAVSAIAESRRGLVESLLSKPRSLESVRALGNEWRLVPSELRDDEYVCRTFSGLREVFIFRVKTPEWTGLVRVNDFWGSSVEVNCQSDNGDPGSDPNFEVYASHNEEFLAFFDPARREAAILAGIKRSRDQAAKQAPLSRTEESPAKQRRRRSQ